MEVSGEHARCVIADLHRAASSPEKQPFQLTVTKQSVCAEVPDKKSSKKFNKHLNVCFLITKGKIGVLDHLTGQKTALHSFTPHIQRLF